MSFDRARAWVIIGVTIFATLTPLVPEWRGRNDDSFPLSWYPMFAKARPAFERPTYVIGRSDAGAREKIDVKWWTTGGFNQGRNMLTATVKKGPAAMGELCAKVAKKVADKKGKRWAAVEEVAIVSGQYDRAVFFGEGDRTPMSEKTLHACRVPR